MQLQGKVINQGRAKLFKSCFEGSQVFAEMPTSSKSRAMDVIGQTNTFIGFFWHFMMSLLFQKKRKSSSIYLTNLFPCRYSPLRTQIIFVQLFQTPFALMIGKRGIFRTKIKVTKLLEYFHHHKSKKSQFVTCTYLSNVDEKKNYIIGEEIPEKFHSLCFIQFNYY